MKRDSIERIKEFQKAMVEIKPILDKEFDDPAYRGKCHQLWCRQKQLLAEKGIDWKTPREMNPHVCFD